MKKIIFATLLVFLLVGCSNEDKITSDSTNPISNLAETENNVNEDENNNSIKDSDNRMNAYIADDNGYRASFDVVKFGSYEQDGIDNGTEAIEWYVVAREDGKALLLSRYVLKLGSYHNDDKTSENITWETCTLRSWLNNNFYEEAFIDNEKILINESPLINNDNPAWGTVGGNDTIDKVFILSIDEIAKYFTFNYADAKGKNYDYSSDDLFSTGTVACYNLEIDGYNITQNSEDFIYTEDLYNEWSDILQHSNKIPVGTNQPEFWVRSPGGRKQYQICICKYGYFCEDLSADCGSSLGIRPAIWVDEAALSMYQ